MSSNITPVQVKKVSNGISETVPDLLVSEEPLEIRIGYGPLGDRQQKSLAVTMRTPGHDYELSIGFLFTEGIISSFDQVESVKYCEDGDKQEQKENVVRVELKPDVSIDFEKLQRHFYTSSSCGVCGKTSIDSVKVYCSGIEGNFRMTSDIVYSLPNTLRKSQTIFEYTGGLHASALFDSSGNIVLMREDVGRHNALDKVVGAMLFKKEVPLSKCILLVSGRISFELVQKAAVAGVPILAAVGAPSSLAVQLAKEVGMTLLGFVRDKRYNIYSGEQRIMLN